MTHTHFLINHTFFSNELLENNDSGRVFNLKECFWFSLNSWTPVGGGEAPKALSGKILMSAYWLFVILMLATFSANLAAFLTIEALQVSSKFLAKKLMKQIKIYKLRID